MHVLHRHWACFVIMRELLELVEEIRLYVTEP